MSAEGIELCDAGFVTARCSDGTLGMLSPAAKTTVAAWPGFAHHRDDSFAFGPEAEDEWLVQPRNVSHTFWDRLSLKASDLLAGRKAPSFSELAFYFLRDYVQRVSEVNGPFERLALAVPGAYLKDRATEEERVGLLLGMACDLDLPLVGIIDLACAALADPTAEPFNPEQPVLHVDVHLHSAEITLLRCEGGELRRQEFQQVPQVGEIAIMRHLMGTMANRFLRKTFFDIQEDRRLEQGFYHQLKRFLDAGVSRPHEHVFQINTTRRSYEMRATREQLESDLTAFESALAQAMGNLLPENARGSVTVAVSSRAARLDGLGARLSNAGWHRLLWLPAGAAARGSALHAAANLVDCDLSHVPVATAMPVDASRTQRSRELQVRFEKTPSATRNPIPTHLVIEGIGHPVEHGLSVFCIDGGRVLVQQSDDEAPEAVDVARILRRGGKIWLVLTGGEGSGDFSPVDAGDRILILLDSGRRELLFAHCPAPGVLNPVPISRESTVP